MDYVFDPDRICSVPVKGEPAEFPVHRIFCVGRNYAAHAAEMGQQVDREAPFYFTKTPSALVPSGATVPYPPGTEDFHHEMELALCIGKPVFRAGPDTAMDAVFGYACSLDMTRRDLQQAARAKQRPWDTGKDFENAAVMAPITRAGEFKVAGQRIHLEVNGETRQEGTLDELVWKIDEIVCDLSKYYHLRPGDVVMTGTPAGVGPVAAGDTITGGIDGLDPVALDIGEAE